MNAWENLIWCTAYGLIALGLWVILVTCL